MPDYFLKYESLARTFKVFTTLSITLLYISDALQRVTFHISYMLSLSFSVDPCGSFHPMNE